MRVLLDTNVIVDSMVQRPPWHKEADAVLGAAALGQASCAATTNLALATVLYVGRKIVTRNVAAVAHSPIPVWEPAELQKRLAAASAAGCGQLRQTPWQGQSWI